MKEFHQAHIYDWSNSITEGTSHGCRLPSIVALIAIRFAMFRACCACRDHNEHQQQIISDPAELSSPSEVNSCPSLSVADPSTQKPFISKKNSQTLNLQGFQLIADPDDLHNNSEASTSATSQLSAQWPSDLQSTPPSSHRSMSSSCKSDSTLSSRGKCFQKARLQDLIKAFVKKAIQGITCTLVTESGDFLPARYLIDKRLQMLMMKVEGRDPLDFHATFPLAQIIGFCQSDIETHIFPKIVHDLSSDEKSRLVMITYLGEESAVERLLFLENDSFDRDQFLSCIKILQKYAQSITLKQTTP